MFVKVLLTSDLKKKSTYLYMVRCIIFSSRIKGITEFLKYVHDVIQELKFQNEKNI